MVRDMTGKRLEYFEAILQLRDCTEETTDFVKKEVSNSGIHLAKVEYHKNGMDLYLADSKYAKALGKKLLEKFGGKYQITASLWGQKDGCKIYRLTILFRGLQFKKDDIVIYHGEDHQVKFLGNNIMLINVNNKKKIHLKYKDLDKIKKKDQFIST